ncbi:prolipoprotein diacylglyceryl transferase [Candidatus Cloacimonadota bacterium]
MIYHNINPTLFKIGFLEIRWYGLMYIFSFILGYILLKKFFELRNIEISREKYDNLLFYIMLGVIVGGRVGYILFYNLPFYLEHPLNILKVWLGGMSFHGGAIGVIGFGYLFCRKNQLKFFQMADPAMPIVSLGLLLGRFGNFINGELYGKVSDLPWAMVFPGSDGKPRHPSQLYEAFLEGALLFLISYLILKYNKREGVVFWSWIGFYGLFRFLVEFVREPDAHLGYIFWFFTMGQILSSVMIIISVVALIILVNRNRQNAEENS